MPRVTIDTPTWTTRKIEIPAVCRCGADLAAAGALTEIEFLERAIAATVEADGSVSYPLRAADNGAAHIAGYQCSKCSHPFAEES